MVNRRKVEKSKLSTSDHPNPFKKKEKACVSHDRVLGSSHSHFKNYQPKSSIPLLKYSS